MPTFDTPTPVSVTLDLVAGDVELTASDRTDTIVEVRPSDAAADADVRAAEQIRIEYADGRLLVKAPRGRGLGLFGRSGSIDVRVCLPTGSSVTGTAALATFRGTGRLGACRIRTASGEVHLEHAAELDLSTSAGTVVVDHASGPAQITTGSGRVRVGGVDGDATIRNSNGDSWVGAITGALRVKAANGDITVERAGGDVHAATANGDVRVGTVARGNVSVSSGCGALDIGVRTGTAALLDLHTQHGRLLNQLESCPAPEQSAETVRVDARTGYGNVVIRRA
ncbi:hypothetical protein C1I95_17125 [Micromonospora craterilacus]|uniref:DUF4097 domain-containing protein n=1 Tax=Micromonospora craterilacus TaxID=1655439 RepID=A0A2W2E1S9_9ACTN|nr:DUF4097 family beta strand repeat-containing protein [Micromonospora craterilacus]PZG16593.1 hypothetical protein C1I95_17125 [Micromonospora craterilacus]